MRPTLSGLGALRTVALALAASVGGCALVLGFEDTSVRVPEQEAGAVDASPGGDAARPGGGDSQLRATPARVLVRRGASAELAIEVTRGASATGAMTVRLAGLPAGVSATSATLAPPAASGSITLTALPSATLGAKTVTLETDGAVAPPIEVPLLVTEAAGTLDVTFDGDGVAAEGARGMGTTFFALAQQPDGQIVAGGSAGAAPGALDGWIIRRYAASGAADAAFNTLATAAGASVPDGALRGLAIDAKGRIVGVGTSQKPAQQLTVVRLLPTGALDKSFGGGVVRLGPDALSSTSGFGVTVQPDGAVIVVGSRRGIIGPDETGIVARFNEDGAPDAAFNGGGAVSIPSARLVGVTLDGAAIVAGGSKTGATPSYVVIRRTAQGAADAAFGGSGAAVLGSGYGANAFALRSDGSLALAGDVEPAGGFTAGAASDKGAALFARSYGSGTSAGFFGLAALANGGLVAAGHAASDKGGARVTRILADGNADATFGTAGTATIQAGGAVGASLTLFAVAVDADGRILVAGNRTDVGGVVLRLWP